MPAEENKAVFRRYVEEVGNEGKLELADEIFDRYLAHQPDGSVLPLLDSSPIHRRLLSCRQGL
jgi:hypothetical protein